MSTNATISVVYKDGTVKSVYLHWDGGSDAYHELVANHNTQEDAEDLVELGSISTLGPRVVSYHLWRNEPWDQVKPRCFNDIGEAIADNDESYHWVYFCNQWNSASMISCTKGIHQILTLPAS